MNKRSELPSAQPEQIARDIATIIENERDMRVILKNKRTETHSCDSERTETHEPPRMRGKWIPTEPDEPCFYQCSLCRRLNDDTDNFCPNCGADMRGGQDEDDRR